jgi:hypothetical protein
VLSSAESDAIFGHPGLLNAARGIALSRVWLGAQSTAHAVSASGEWFRGGVGFGLQALSAASYAEHAASFAYARTLFRFRVGAVAKVVEQTYSAGRETFGAADIGLARSVGPATLAVTGRNLGPDPAFRAADQPVRLPSAVTLGAASRNAAAGPLDMLLVAHGSWVRDLPFSFGGGLEVSYWPVTGRTFAARIGFSHVDASPTTPLTLGGGFTGDRLSIDYAFQAGDLDSSADVHRVTLRWR